MQIKKIKLETHTTYHNCDDCGVCSSEIYTVSCKGFSFTHGDPAYCYGNEDGDLEIVLPKLFEYLNAQGIDVKMPVYDPDGWSTEEGAKLNNEYDDFVHRHKFILYLAQFGIDVKMKHKSDDYPVDDYDDDIEFIEIEE